MLDYLARRNTGLADVVRSERSCKIFVMTIQSDYESTSLFSPFQYPLLGLTKEDKGAMKVSCACRIYEKADF